MSSEIVADTGSSVDAVSTPTRPAARPRFPPAISSRSIRSTQRAPDPRRVNPAHTTHLLLPHVHRLLELLLVLVQQHVDDVQVLHVPVSLKVVSDLQADHRGRDVERVQRDDLGSLGVSWLRGKGR